MTIDKGNEGVVTDRPPLCAHYVLRSGARNMGRNAPRRVPTRSLRQINSIRSLRKPHHFGDGVNFFEPLGGQMGFTLKHV
ncbi:MAG: hypothetical protein HW396_1667 [Candidatus Dadabacteria bacterium]|nr:hypothetical protein [Candidatus Dadabacteria bacterium]